MDSQTGAASAQQNGDPGDEERGERGKGDSNGDDSLSGKKKKKDAEKSKRATPDANHNTTEAASAAAAAEDAAMASEGDSDSMREFHQG